MRAIKRLSDWATVWWCSKHKTYDRCPADKYKW